MKNLIFLSILCTALCLTSCGKKTYGCTDSTAKNYDANADINNNQCVYTGTVVFWQKTDQGVLDVTIENETKKTTVFYASGQPECSKNGCATFELEPGTYNFVVTNFQFQWTGKILVQKNVCNKQIIQ